MFVGSLIFNVVWEYLIFDSGFSEYRMWNIHQGCHYRWFRMVEVEYWLKNVNYTDISTYLIQFLKIFTQVFLNISISKKKNIKIHVSESYSKARKDSWYIIVIYTYIYTYICLDQMYTVSWGAWNNWSQCSQTCGGGIKSRVRKCDSSAKNCKGRNFESRICNNFQCKSSRWYKLNNSTNLT